MILILIPTGGGINRKIFAGTAGGEPTDITEIRPSVLQGVGVEIL